MDPRSLVLRVEHAEKDVNSKFDEIAALEEKIKALKDALIDSRADLFDAEDKLTFYRKFLERSNGRYPLCEEAYEGEDAPLAPARRSVFSPGKMVYWLDNCIALTGGHCFSLTRTEDGSLKRMFYNRNFDLVQVNKAMSDLYTYDKAVCCMEIEEGDLLLKEHEELVYLDEGYDGSEENIFRNKDGRLEFYTGPFSVLHEGANEQSNVWFYTEDGEVDDDRFVKLEDLSGDVTRSYFIPSTYLCLFVFDGVLYYLDQSEGIIGIYEAHSRRAVLKWRSSVIFVNVVVCTDYIVVSYQVRGHPGITYQIVHIDFP